MTFSSCTNDSEIDAIINEVTDEAAEPFQWTRAEDMETRAQFRRNFGVGYSYDAVRGTYCDWEDIRCQVVNRATLSELQETTGEQLIFNIESHSVRTLSEYNYSMRDYVAAVHLDTREEIDLGLYNKTKRTRQDFLEDGIQEKFYYTLDEELIMAESYISPANIFAFFRRGNTKVLTTSFINAIKHLQESDIDDIAAVDSFVNVWGTHVIIKSLLGGKIRVDLMNDMWRFNDKAKEDEWTSEEFLGAAASKDENRTNKDDYKWVEHGRLNITAYGGDQSTLTGLLGEHAPDGTRTFSTEGISAWRQSLKYNVGDENNSNVEMVEMTVIPIWDFAEAISPLVARRLKAVILQDVALQQSLLGNRNFFDTKFPLRYNTATCQYQQSTGKWQTYTRTDSNNEPMMVSIVSGGRITATVCHEQIDKHDLWVCYPIYEGKVKIACGLGVDENNIAYKVCWLNGKATVTPTGTTADDNLFYINGGEVNVKSQDFLNYADAYAIPSIELSGGIRPDGSYDVKQCVNVTKNLGDFEIRVPNTASMFVLDCWKKDESQTNSDYTIYKRTSDYIYLYNPSELK
ncbi:MAG: hypothetical protein K5683_10510 [Prevotella sp.]|nr:hypothetical protein [Prevotella sp.]